MTKRAKRRIAVFISVGVLILVLLVVAINWFYLPIDQWPRAISLHLKLPTVTTSEGIRPEKYSETLLQSGALLNGVRVEDGYIYVKPGEGRVRKLDLQGEIIWKKAYPFVHKAQPGYFSVHEDGSGNGFFVVYDVNSHGVRNGKRVDFPPVLARMDVDGNLLWQREYPGKSDCALQYVFALPSGEIVTVGSNESDHELGVSGPSDLYLSKRSAEGELLLEKTITSLDQFDYVHMAQYIPGHGLFVFDGFNSHHLLLLDENLEVLWQQASDEFIVNAAVSGETVFYSYLGEMSEDLGRRIGRLRTIDMQGETREIPNMPDNMQLLGPAGEYIAVTGEHGVCLLNNTGVVVLELPMPGWTEYPHEYITGGMTITKALPAQDGYIVVCEILGELKPSHPAVNHMTYITETVFAGYDMQGQEIWKYGFTH
ncbi:MAG: hypothetical protein FWC27_07055 [Firmicutes bacterium]|nr:hypothetical protein [Bacillota bacterium]